MILRDSGGKTCKVKAQFGKVMRHRVAELCPIGALGLYLMARFELTKEPHEFDFLTNSSWFNHKLLISPQVKKEKWSK